MDSDSDQSLERLDAALAPYRDRPVYFERLYGNNGDELIVLGAEHAIRSAGCLEVHDPQQADALLVVGGAGLSSVWGGGYKRTERYMSGSLGEKPLVIFPSTLSFEANDYAEQINGRPGPTTLIARERPSLARVQAVDWNDRVRIGLDHDTAFRLAETPWFEGLKRRRGDRHLLIVERRDAEAVTGLADGAVAAPSFLKQLVPEPIKRRIKRSRHRKSRSSGPFYDWAIEQSRSGFGAAPWMDRVVPLDASLKGILTFEQFVDLIVDAGGVLTTRLHVGILAAMLGKPTILVGGDPRYAKISGIYEHSMQDMEHVTFLDNPFHKPK